MIKCRVCGCNNYGRDPAEICLTCLSYLPVGCERLETKDMIAAIRAEIAAKALARTPAAPSLQEQTDALAAAMRRVV